MLEVDVGACEQRAFGQAHLATPDRGHQIGGKHDRSTGIAAGEWVRDLLLLARELEVDDGRVERDLDALDASIEAAPAHEDDSEPETRFRH